MPEFNFDNFSFEMTVKKEEGEEGSYVDNYSTQFLGLHSTSTAVFHTDHDQTSVEVLWRKALWALTADATQYKYDINDFVLDSLSFKRKTHRMTEWEFVKDATLGDGEKVVFHIKQNRKTSQKKLSTATPSSSRSNNNKSTCTIL